MCVASVQNLRNWSIPGGFPARVEGGIAGAENGQAELRRSADPAGRLALRRFASDD